METKDAGFGHVRSVEQCARPRGSTMADAKRHSAGSSRGSTPKPAQNTADAKGPGDQGAALRQAIGARWVTTKCLDQEVS